MLIAYSIFLALVFAVFLACLASFLKLVIDRTAREESFLGGRSRCEHCQQQIAWYDNLPVWSFLRLRGRCRSCQQPIDASCFWSELAAFIFGLAFFAAYFWLPAFSWWPALDFTSMLGLSLEGLIFFVLFFILLSDWQYLLVPDFLTLLLLFLVIARHLILGIDWPSALFSAIMAFAFLGGLAFLAKKILGKDAMGLGDLKLVLPLALLLSWPKTGVMLFLAFLLGGFFAMLMLATQRKKIGQALPFAPFLIVGALLSFYFGEAIWQWYFGLLF